MSFVTLDSVGEAILEAFCPSSPASELGFEGATELVAVLAPDSLMGPSDPMPARRMIFMEGCVFGASSEAAPRLKALSGVGLCV